MDHASFSDGLQTLLVCGGKQSSKQQVIGRMSVNDMKLMRNSDWSYWQVEVHEFRSARATTSES